MQVGFNLFKTKSQKQPGSSINFCLANLNYMKPIRLTFIVTLQRYNTSFLIKPSMRLHSLVIKDWLKCTVKHPELDKLNESGFGFSSSSTDRASRLSPRYPGRLQITLTAQTINFLQLGHQRKSCYSDPWTMRCRKVSASSSHITAGQGGCGHPPPYTKQTQDGQLCLTCRVVVHRSQLGGQHVLDPVQNPVIGRSERSHDEGVDNECERWAET